MKSPVSTENCGSCCQEIKFVITATEADHLTSGGTHLTSILPAMSFQWLFEQFNYYDESDDLSGFVDWSKEEPAIRESFQSFVDHGHPELVEEIVEVSKTMRPGDGYYLIAGRCGFLLDDGACGDYENRPKVCQEFEVDGEACRKMRHRGVPVTIQPRIPASA